MKTYCAQLRTRKDLEQERAQEGYTDAWGWWSDVCPGAALTLRDATQADIERCTLRDNASRNTADWLCELGDRGSLVSRKAIAKLTVIESQAGLSATSNTAILDGEAPDKKNGSDLRPLSEQTHAITSEAMAAAFRNPNALGKLEAVISSLDRVDRHE